MILSDHAIRDHLAYSHFRNTIGVDPLPDDKQIQPASLDLRLGRKLYDVEKDQETKSTHHELQPMQRYLGHTTETVELPNHIAGQLAGRSSIGRRGVIVHKTAGWIDPGFKGEITFELMNLGKEPVVLEAGERVAQLVFFELDQSSSGYDGQYQEQTGPTVHEANQD